MSDLVIVYGGPLIATTHNKCLYYYAIMASQKVGHSSITPTIDVSNQDILNGVQAMLNNMGLNTVKSDIANLRQAVHQQSANLLCYYYCCVQYIIDYCLLWFIIRVCLI